MKYVIDEYGGEIEKWSTKEFNEIMDFYDGSQSEAEYWSGKIFVDSYEEALEISKAIENKPKPNEAIEELYDWQF